MIENNATAVYPKLPVSQKKSDMLIQAEIIDVSLVETVKHLDSAT